MTISRIEEIIEKRFQIKMTRNRSYQILWHSRDERILVSNIRSDYMIIEIEKGLNTLKMPFTNEKQLIQILHYFVHCAGELNQNNKMKRQHTQEYVIKIAEEMGFTTYEVMRQVMEYTGSIVYGLDPFNYLRQFNAKDIRKILTYKRKEKENE